MRLALVIERFDPEGGGAETTAWNFAHALARAGDEVHVVARHAVASPAVQLHRVRIPNVWQPLRVVAFSRAAARAVGRQRFDCVLSFARTRRQDVYRAGAGSHADYMRRRYAGRSLPLRLSPRHAILLAAERRIFRDPRQHIVCNSQQVHAEIKQRYGVSDDRLSIVTNGVDLERFHPRHRATAGAGMRRAHGVQTAPVWGFAGSGFARKGLDTALRALARGGPANAELWVAGRDEPGAWRQLAERLGVAARVRFLGAQRDMAAFYAAADALLLPTRYDAFANVCLEAAAAGLPVVTSGATGAAELFRAQGGVVRDPEDVGGFAAALDRLADPATRERLGAAARRVAEHYPWEAQTALLRERLCKVAR